MPYIDVINEFANKSFDQVTNTTIGICMIPITPPQEIITGYIGDALVAASFSAFTSAAMSRFVVKTGNHTSSSPYQVNMKRNFPTHTHLSYVTSATINTLQNSAIGSFPAVVAPGALVGVTSGTGAGQYRIISAVDGNTITVSTDWETIPASGDSYRVHAESFTTERFAISFSGSVYLHRWMNSLNNIPGAKAKIQLNVISEYFTRWNPGGNQRERFPNPSKWGPIDDPAHVNNTGVYNQGTLLSEVDRNISLDTNNDGIITAGDELPSPFTMEFDVTSIFNAVPVDETTGGVTGGVWYVWFRTSDELQVQNVTAPPESFVLTEVTTTFDPTTYPPILFFTDADDNVLSKPYNGSFAKAQSEDPRTPNVVIVS